MKVLFWNTQRLGKGSKGKSPMVSAVIAHAIHELDVDVCLFCEVTSDLAIDDVNVSKQLAVTKRDPRKRRAQLGYGCLMSDGDDNELVEFQVSGYTAYFGESIRYRGGNLFSQQSKRKVASCGQVGTTALFMYHANSSYKSAELVNWIVAALDQSYQEFLLVGDFNCSPQDLGNVVQIQGVRIADGGATHNVKAIGGAQTTLDYAVGKGVNPTVTVLDKKDFFDEAGLEEMPDHFPIIVEF